jgi:F420-dependent oxidoreductase-like protein
VKIGLQAPNDPDFRGVGEEIAELEALGLDTVMVAEGYAFDAVSQLGYLAACTHRAELISGILPIFSRTPPLTAMTAAGLDYVSGGRFTLGIGTSGPQVIEGFHGVRFDAPVQRTREVVEICREIWQRKPVTYSGKHYSLPLPPDQGTGLGKPLKLINYPLRADIPISIASIGPKNVELTAEIAQAWQPIFLLPDLVDEVFGGSIAAGAAKRDPSLGQLQILNSVPVAIGEDADELLDLARPRIALYVGGMGARGHNFYNELACRYGFEEAAATIQDLYLDGRKDEAAAAVPDELVRKTTLIGPRSYVAERLEVFAEAGVTTIFAQTVGDHTREGRRTMIESLVDLAH